MVVAPPCVKEDERIYAIGDIHGRSDLLVRLLEEIRLDASSFRDGRRTRLVILGNAIDFGDRSSEVLDIICALNIELGSRLTCLRGNHEEALLDFLELPTYSWWINNGGSQTVVSYGLPLPAANASPEERVKLRDSMLSLLGPHLNLLRQMPLISRSGATIFAHSGYAPGICDAEQPIDTVLWSDSPCAAVPHDALLVHGHFDAANPVDSPNRICIDTGAYYSGRLTAVRLDAGRTFLST